MSDHQITMVVRDKIPALAGERYIVCHNEDYALILDLDAEWDAYDTVTVLFHMPRGGTVTVLSEGRRCAVPACTEQGIMRVGITAGNVLRTSTPAEITVLRSARNDADEEAVTMPPDITQQIIARQDELEKKLEQGGVDPDVIIGFNRADVLLNTIKPSTFYVEKGSLLDVKAKVLAGGIPNTVIRHHFSGDGIVEYHFDPSGQYFNFGSGDDSIIFEFIARFGSVLREYTVKATGDDINLNKFTTAISTAVVSKTTVTESGDNITIMIGG